MHEAGIAQALLAQAIATAEAGGLRSITALRIEVGVRRLVEPESLRLYFEVLAQGTIAEGSVLTVAEIPMRARCRACGREYGPVLRDFRCPACTAAEPEMLAGDDITLAAVSGDDAKG